MVGAGNWGRGRRLSHKHIPTCCVPQPCLHDLELLGHCGLELFVYLHDLRLPSPPTHPPIQPTSGAR